MIALTGGMLNVHMDGAGTASEIWSFPGESCDGAAGVLNGTRINAQYGWPVSGLWSPPAGGCP